MEKIPVIFFIIIFSFTLSAKNYDLNSLRREFSPPNDIPISSENAYSRKKESLGLSLFFSRLLDKNKYSSCGSCHNPFRGFADEFTFSLGSGGNRTTRNSPSIINLAWSDHFFWDGRVDSLEKQVIFPIESPLELNLKMEELVQRLKAEREYVKKFNEVFPKEGITKETIASALATFVRTIKSHKAPFDKWIKGDARAINESAKRGFDLFRGRAKCINCHFGWRFTNDQFADIGVLGNDIGRGKFDSEFNFAFKTPGLRKISETAPYMHNGSLATLDEVIEFFNRGGDAKRHSVQITPLNLTSYEKKDLKEFLLTLTDKEIRPEILKELTSAKEYWRKKRFEELGY